MPRLMSSNQPARCLRPAALHAGCASLAACTASANCSRLAFITCPTGSFKSDGLILTSPSTPARQSPSIKLCNLCIMCPYDQFLRPQSWQNTDNRVEKDQSLAYLPPPSKALG